MDRINEFPHKKQPNERNHNEHQPLDVNDKTPVNQIVMPYDQIKAYDMDTNLTLELKRENEIATDVNDIAFFILANSKDEYTNVENYSVDDGVVNFTMPKVDTDKYYPQIMDKQGRVYSSNDNQFIDVVYNRESRVNELFPMIKHEVIEKVTPAVKQFVMDNKEQFSITGATGLQGPKGDKGDQGVKGNKGNRGEKGDKGDRGDRGEKGDQGERGYRGNRGPDGPQGPIGPQGPKGADGTVEFDLLTPEQQQSLVGPEGPQGPEGPKGVDGDVEFTELTEEQIEMIRGPKGETGMQGPDGPEGPQGPQGEQGPQGPKGVDGDVTQVHLDNELENLNDSVISQREDYSTNASDFGVVGDGVSDDTLALQNAINHANTKSRVLYIPKGKYLISESLVLNGCSVYGPKGNVYEKTNYQGVVIVCATQDFIAIKQGSLKRSDIQFTLSDIMVENALIGFEINYVINSVFSNLYVRLSDTGFKMGDVTAVGSMFNHFNNFYTVDCRIGIESHSKSYFNNNTFNNGFISGDEYAIKINVSGGYGAVNNTFNNVEIKSTLGRGIILESNSNTNFNNCYFEVGGNAIRTLNFCAFNLTDCVYGVFKAENTNGDTSVVFAENGVYVKVDGGVIFLNEGNTNGLFYDATLEATHQNIYQYKAIRRSGISTAPGFQMYASKINQVVYQRDLNDVVRERDLNDVVRVNQIKGFVDTVIDPFSFDTIGIVGSPTINTYSPNINSESVDSNGVFTLSEGCWSIDISLRIAKQTDNEGFFVIALYQNDNVIKRTMKSANTNDTAKLSTTLYCNEGDKIRFNIFGYDMPNDGSEYNIIETTGANYLTMKKIGGL